LIVGALEVRNSEPVAPRYVLVLGGVLREDPPLSGEFTLPPASAWSSEFAAELEPMDRLDRLDRLDRMDRMDLVEESDRESAEFRLVRDENEDCGDEALSGESGVAAADEPGLGSGVEGKAEPTGLWRDDVLREELFDEPELLEVRLDDPDSREPPAPALALPPPPEFFLPGSACALVAMEPAARALSIE